MIKTKELVYYASKAPSGHNSQPWKFTIKENIIEIHPNLTCALPVVDPDNRELFISLGCATQNLCVTALHFGYDCCWKIKQNSQNTHYIVIEINKLKEKQGNQLFDFIDKRQTNRNVYDGKIVENDIIEQLQKISNENSVGIYFFKNGEANFQTLKEAVFKGNEIQMNDIRFKKELLSWIRFNKKEVDRLQNGLTYKVMGAPPTPKFIGKMIVQSFLKSKKQNKSDAEKINSSSHFILFTTKENTVHQWVKLGVELQKILLNLTKLGISCSYLNPPCELKSLALQLQKNMPINNEYPSILLRIGYAKNVPFSPRKDIEKIINNE